MSYSNSTGKIEKNFKSMAWQEILKNSIKTPEQLFNNLNFDARAPEDFIHILNRVIKVYPMNINGYYLSLIRNINDPIWKQSIPDIMELSGSIDLDDPLNEEKQSKVPNLIHRYPDRVVFLISNKCAVYCRFCMRKRRIGKYSPITDINIEQGINYIKKNENIREVILSGGDPLLINNEKLAEILLHIRSISHVEIIRIHTRLPCTLPQRITTKLAKILQGFQPIYINIHFNHPDEITQESSKACNILADLGIPLGSQTVLLKGVNDKELVIKKLMQKLLSIRVRPYYLHHPDLVRGTKHFRLSPERGLDIIRSMRGYSSGMCIPHYMIDLPGGEGKIPIIPDYIKYKGEKNWDIETYMGKEISYPID